MDVARLAGVSGMTVSRVLNNRPRVSPETRARVLAAMQELNFQPSTAARALVTGRSKMLGVVSFDSTFYGPASTLFAIERAARDLGYYTSTLMLREDDPWTSADVIGHLMSQRVDGFIFAAPQVWTVTALPRLPAEVPAVAIDGFLWSPSGPGQRPVSVIAPEQSASSAAVVRHLLDLGHDTVWHVAGPKSWAAAQAREQAWRDTLTGAGREAPPVLYGDWTAESGYDLGKHLAGQRNVTAVFAANDMMAVGVLHALREAGIDVPGQVSLVGFDDVPEAAHYWPPLTTVRQNFDEVGRRALDLILGQIDGEAQGDHRIAVPSELIVRESTVPPSGSRTSNQS
jgi:DNA-binding LacI/PurR family transcriptional regulator